MALYSGKNNNKISNKNKLKKYIGTILISVSTLLLINLIFNLIPAINSFFLGTFGILAYVILICMMILGVLIILNKPIYLETKDLILLIAWVFVFICILHLATTTKIVDNSYGEYLLNCYNQKLTAAGIIFGIIVYPFAFLTHTVAAFVIFSIALIIISAFIILRYYNFKQLGKTKQTTESILKLNKNEKDELITETKPITDKPVIKETEDAIFISDTEAKNYKKNKENIIETNSRDKQKAKELLGLSSSEPIQAPKKEKIDIYKTNVNNTNDNERLLDHEPRPRKIIHSDFKNENVVNEKPAKNLTEADRKNLDFLRATGLSKKEIEEEQKTNVNIQNENLQKQSSNFDHFLNDYTNNIVNDSDDLYDENINRKNYKQTYEAKQKLFANNGNYEQQEIYKKPVFDDDNRLNIESTNNYNNLTTKPTIDNNVSENKFGSFETSSKTTTEFHAPIIETPVKENYSQIKLDGIDFEKPKKKTYKRPSKYVKPPIDLLKIIDSNLTDNKEDYNQKAEVLEQALASFKIPAKVVSITKGPAFTRFELQMQQGVSVKRVNGYINDIAMILESHGDVRVEIPIAGKNAFGVEIPNEQIATVGLRDILESYAFQGSKSLLTFGLGKDITGDCKVAKLDKMPHLLVAGSTGSGKSVCLNSLLISLIYKAGPDDIKFILIDPKRVEFTLYNGLPHLLIPQVITSPDKAISSLNWAIDEMEKRFNLFADVKVRNMEEYNLTEEVTTGIKEKMPFIVIVIDELADLLLQGKKEVEEKIMRIAQKSRAAGIHLVIATQRPSVDVITGTIKANLPSRIAFAVSSFADSKTILDQGGAEKLLGKGDMLFSPLDMPDATRIQGAFISNQEVEAVVNYVKEHNEFEFDSEIADEMFNKKQNSFEAGGNEEEYDPLLKDALRSIIRSGSASISKIQRMFGVGYPRAGKIIDQMEKAGFISAADNKNNRTIFITQQEFEERFGEDL